jgi:hypothetical protein
MVPKAFPKLCDVLVNLREVSINDAQDITHELRCVKISVGGT